MTAGSCGVSTTTTAWSTSLFIAPCNLHVPVDWVVGGDVLEKRELEKKIPFQAIQKIFADYCLDCLT